MNACTLYNTDTKNETKRLRAKGKMGSKSKKSNIDILRIISHLGCINNIFVDCTVCVGGGDMTLTCMMDWFLSDQQH